MIDFSHIKKKDLLKLPERVGNEKVYEQLLIVPTRIKHESGWARIAIIGITEDGAEIAAYPDDINWDFSEVPQIELAMRTDCYYPSGILRVWSHRVKFQVGIAISSTDIKLLSTPKPTKEGK